MYGSYEFLVMPSELRNAVTTFCSIMKMKFHNYVDKFVVVFLGDIVTNSESLEKHFIHLKLVFSC